MKPVLPGYPMLKVGVAVYLGEGAARGKRRLARKRGAHLSLAQRWRIVNGLGSAQSEAKVSLQRTIGAVRPREP